MTGTTAVPELAELLVQLDAARKPEDIFGPAAGARRTYLRLAQLAHPDRYNGDGRRDEAERAMVRLNTLWQIAERSLRAGTYGTTRSSMANPLRIQTKRNRYTLHDEWRKDEISNYYLASSDNGDRVIRVVRKPRDSDLIANEVTILKHLYGQTDDEPGYRAYLPHVVDTFTIKNGSTNRRANAFDEPSGLWTLQAVIDAYPAGIHPRDGAWIFRRLLMALSLAQAGGVVHGAVLPSNVLIQPAQHGLVLVNWSYARNDGGPLSAMVSRYHDLYPEEVLAKSPALRETDIYMAAMTTIRALGGKDRLLPESVPRTLRAFFKGCTLQRASRRPDDAGALRDNFSEVLERTFGPRKFHTFAMPTTAKEE